MTMLAPLALLTAAAATPAAPVDLPGIWEGTVGTLPVRACFVHREWGTFGAYYYLSRRRLIPLEAPEHGGGFDERGEADGPAPHWTIESAGPSQLIARWAARGRTLPVRLTRLARLTGEESPCSAIAFHRPRLEGLRLVRSRAAKDGVAYTRIVLDTAGRFEEVSFETFALDGASAAAGRINAALGTALTGDPPSWFECITDSLADSPNEGGFDESLTPTMISRRWLAVTHHWDGSCGGAHPDSTNAYRLFDRTDGREIDLHDWLNAGAVHRERPDGGEEIKTLLPAFREAILAGWHSEGADCDEPVRNEDFWTIGLTRTGLVFSPVLPHVVQACGEDFTMPFERLRPFLTPEGAAQVRALQAEPAPPPDRAAR
ncbi:MAG: hypothetical protein JO276_16760 [Sphingomonadaceae bacterium]|nr:hypothetical protein [Sphingomonadaceae bacterium]